MCLSQTSYSPQNRRPLWFTWANSTMHRTLQIPSGQTVPLSLSLPASLSLPPLPGSLPLSLKLLVQVTKVFPHPAGASAIPNPILLSNSQRCFMPDPLCTQTSLHHQEPRSPPSPFRPHPASHTTSQWKRSTLSVETCWQEPPQYLYEKEEGGRRGEREREKDGTTNLKDRVRTMIYIKEVAAFKRVVRNEINKPLPQIPIVGEMYWAMTFPFLRWNGVKSPRHWAGRGPWGPSPTPPPLSLALQTHSTFKTGRQQ